MDPEHVWPDWMSRLFDKHYAPHTYTIRSWDSEGHEFSRIAKSVNETRDYICKPCNGGWMSDIESHASPVLTPLIVGAPRNQHLTDLDIPIINAWMIKTAMVIDFQKARDPQKHRIPFYTPAQRLRFKELLETPEHTSIWLGRFLGTTLHAGRFAARYHKLGGKHFGNQKNYILTFTVRELVLQLVTLRRTRRSGPILATECDTALPWELYCVPTTPIYYGDPWPPPLHFDDKTIEVFVNRWNKRGAVMEKPHRPFMPSR